MIPFLSLKDVTALHGDEINAAVKQFIELYNNEAFAVSEMYGLISQWERNNGVKILL